ncbi:MAG: formylglycine-generating enzyme family protein [Lacipirellulaceae bacterium]
MDLLLMHPLAALVLLVLSFGRATAFAAAAAPGAAPSVAGEQVGIALETPDGERAVELGDRCMVAYTQKVPGTDVEFAMIPIPGGTVRLNVAAEDADEPQYAEVTVPPMWVGRCEVTWAEYRQYMQLDKQFARLKQLRTLQVTQADKIEALLAQRDALRWAMVAPGGEGPVVDAVTAPTPLYDPSTTYESGEDPGLPAVSMTLYGAKQYTKWLSAVTGSEYRVPSEAEWLYAAHAGSDVDTALEDEELDLDELAWHADNSDYAAHQVAEKAPNAWGLYDTLGNVAELVLDAHLPEGRADLVGKKLAWRDAVAWPVTAFPVIAKGGWWDDDPADVRLATRLATDDPEWKSSDPNLPASPWWFADYPSTGVGFRLVRPLEGIADADKPLVWDDQTPKIANAVRERLAEGRGKQGRVGAQLPAAIKELADPEVSKLID